MQPARRRLAFLSAALAALAVILAAVLPLTMASAAVVSAAGTRVGASHPQTILAVGASHRVSPGEGRVQGLLQPGFAAGACVAAEDTGALSDAAAACGGMSFTPGTKVLLASGLAIPLTSLKPGDKVLATNTRTGESQAEHVSAVLVHHDTDLYDLTIGMGHRTAVIHTTESHLFWNQTTHQWVEAAAIHHGNRLRAASGDVVVAVAGAAPETRSGEMWDLTVLDDHDFYVSAGSADILVHNCPAPPESAGEPNRWSKPPWEDVPPREQWTSGTGSASEAPGPVVNPDTPAPPAGTWARILYTLAQIARIIHNIGPG